MKKLFFILIAVQFSGCKTVRPADLEAWRGVPVSELETHPLFNTLPLERRPVSTGETIYIYSNTAVQKGPVNCQRTILGIQCTGGDEKIRGCSNQFIVKNNTVLEYRPIGQCYTDCSVRPVSKYGSCD